jgi:flavin-dependent dehydrogenase
MKVDIIGGGLGGLAAAISLKKHNSLIEVNIHEKHKQIGFNTDARKCGEAHSIEKDWLKWKPSNDSIATEILHAETIMGNKTIRINRKPGTAWILDRPKFISNLGNQAEKLGVNIFLNDKIKSIEDTNADYIIDASGCPSIIKRKLGLNKGIKALGYQQTLHDCNCYIKDTIKIIFHSDYGYIWIFPRRPKYEEVNIGIGYHGKNKLNLKKIIEEFKEENNIHGNIDHITGGLIPCGIQPPLQHKNILFVGDAGVGTFPLTGQGIYRALMSGDVAGKLIAADNYKKYSYEMKRLFIKWHFIGCSFVYLNHFLNKINPDLSKDSWGWLFNFFKLVHI